LKKNYQQDNNTNKERKKLEFCCCCLHFGGVAGVVLHTVFVLALVVGMGDRNMRT
jgi:hypothetical protein